MINYLSGRKRVLPVAAAVGAAAAVVVAAVASAGPATAADEPARHVLPGSRPHWLSQAKVIGEKAAASEKISFGLLLKLRNSAAAEAQVAAVSDPASAAYGHWLTTAQFKAAYAPGPSDVGAVQSWLRSQGFQLRDTLGGMYVEASGTTAQIDRAFGTTVQKYSYQGRTVRANSTDLSLPGDTPAPVLGAVSSVLGIDDARPVRKPADTLPGPLTGSRTARPCSSYYGQKKAPNGDPYVVCGYTPKQLQSAYGVSSLIKRGVDGRGVTVAMTDVYASPTIAEDVDTYSRRHGLPALRSGQLRQITPGPDGYDSVDSCGGAGWYREETLDVEAVHAMAPGANIVYVGAADCFAPLDEAWASTIDNHVADIVTNSWGFDTDDISLLGADAVAFYQQFSLEAALTGITVDFSSGDSGDYTDGGVHPELKSVSFPADLPWVTAVGGTSVGIGRDGRRVWEHGWQTAYTPITAEGAPTGETAFDHGGGGGTSVLHAQPFYQRGVVPSSISEYFGPTPMRAVPDISLAADNNTGFLVGQTEAFAEGNLYDEGRVGGTSVAAPLLAGLQAVGSQKAHRPLGFVNPTYYREAGTSALNDLTAPQKPLLQVRPSYVNRVDATGGISYQLENPDVQTSTLHDTKGYDTETGVGSPGPDFLKN